MFVGRKWKKEKMQLYYNLKKAKKKRIRKEDIEITENLKFSSFLFYS